MPIVLPRQLEYDWRPLPEHGDQPRITKRGFRGWVLHTAVSNGRSVWGYFAGPTSVESTLYTRKDGTGEQYMWVDETAHCQLDGNWWSAFGGSGFASIETWDGAYKVWDGRDVSDIPPWTSEQIESITDVLAWSSQEDVLNFPLQPASGPRGYGVGYHKQFTRTEPYEWNRNHACPGNERIEQVPGVIALARKKATTTIIGGDMPSAQEVADALARSRFKLTDGEIERGHYSGAVGEDKTVSFRSLQVHAAIGGRRITVEVIPALTNLASAVEKLLGQVELTPEIAAEVREALQQAQFAGQLTLADLDASEEPQ